MLTIMVLTTEEKVFIIEHYFRSYGVGHRNGPSLHHVGEYYEEHFNKTAPSNKIIVAIVGISTVRDQFCVNGRDELGAQEPSPQTRIINNY